tara:strand:- start:739 stop:1110 length:372 start_codon:yes stop_codon:yes gene_type:complete
MKFSVLIIVTLLSFTFFISEVNSQQVKQVPVTLQCDDRKKIFKILENNKEDLLIDGTGLVKSAINNFNYPTRFGLFANQETKTFTVLIMFNDLLTCLLFPGSNFEPYTGENPWDLLKEKVEIK